MAAQYRSLALDENFELQALSDVELELAQAVSASTRSRRTVLAASVVTAVLLVSAVHLLSVRPAKDVVAPPGRLKMIGLAVAGHTNLVSGACKEAAVAVQKMEELAAQEEATATQDEGELVQEERKMNMAFAAGKAGSEVLQHVDETLDQATLEDAAATGAVITADDMDNLVNCELGKTDVAMEEQPSFDGHKLLEGDILVPPTSGEERELKQRILLGEHWAGDLWPNGRVKYCLAPDIRDLARDAFKDAVRHIESQVPCVHFEEVQANHSDCAEHPSIMVHSPEASACNSYVGRVLLSHRRSQELNLGRGCETTGVAVHELCHALGMTHEQSRRDRNRYLTVVKDNIADGMERNFAVDADAYTGSDYDMLSLMHYSSTTFGQGGRVTLQPHEEYMQRHLGQRLGLSELDVRHLGSMYRCEDKVAPLVHNQELSESLASEARSEVAPITRQGCLCKQEPWEMEGRLSCATEENGFCCNPSEDSIGDWCKTEGQCYGSDFDYCVQRPPPPQKAVTMVTGVMDWLHLKWQFISDRLLRAN